MTYTYDTWGNITEKKIYAYTTATNPGTPTSTIPYSYTNSTWGDQMTQYNGQTIYYDSMGNPTTYRGKTLTWNGKELTSVTGTASYTYDMNGLRTTKTVGGTTTNYFYNNTVLMGLTTGTTYLLFSYDASGLVQAVNYNGTYYYYLRNGQGDIVKIIDDSGNTVVEYAYDSWGKQLSCTGTLATTLGALNPFRYRGYVYDEETGFYYLKSRYYDPETCRFISADVYLSTGQGVLGHVCYAYCLNNPVNGYDSTGYARNTTDDNNKNGIPDYLEEQWIELTNRCRAIMSGIRCRDVTNEVNSALELATSEGRSFTSSVISLEDWTAKSLKFYMLVDHNKPWDIKREKPWHDTIKTDYPGGPNEVVIYNGHYYTPEMLGNYTYGALGRAYGFGLRTLFAGSMFAAKYPRAGTREYDNEMTDRLFIVNGYYSGH